MSFYSCSALSVMVIRRRFPTVLRHHLRAMVVDVHPEKDLLRCCARTRVCVCVCVYVCVYVCVFVYLCS